MKNVTPYRILMSLVVCCLLMPALPAVAKELPVGTVVSKANLDQIKNDTFQGHTIGSMLTENMEYQVRNTGLTFKLANSKPLEMDPKFWAATKKNAGTVKYNPQTREASGYVAGLPFQNIDPSDPAAGDKVIWNYYYAVPDGRDIHYDLNFVTINRNGFEASQVWTFQRIYSRARLGEAKSPIPETDVFTKTLFAGIWPDDVKGVGTYTVRYDSKDPAKNRVEDTFAYIKSARRTRRLTGSAWMDAVGGLDMLQDDVHIWNTRPSWYKQVKVVGKRWILVTTEGRIIRNASAKGSPAEFPQVNFKEKPYWNFIDAPAIPREVWVVEGIPPAEHPYGKKVVYIDTQVPSCYLGEMYDRQGKIWRSITYFYQPTVGKTTGIKYFATYFGRMIDFKASHATLFMIHSDSPTGGAVPDNGDKWDRYSVEMLDRIQ